VNITIVFTNREGVLMKKNVCILSSLVIIVLLAMISCATTTMKAVWKDESYQGEITNVLIIGVSKQSVRKRYFEDEFVRQLNTRGLSATPSYRIFPSEEMLEKDTVLSKAREMKIDTILITRMVDKKTIETYVPGQTYMYTPPPHYRSVGGYYGESYIYSEPGYTIKDEVVVLETNLYNEKSEDLIWSAQSETIVEGPEERVIKKFITRIVKNLSENNLIK
jgi:hypothetical protein